MLQLMNAYETGALKIQKLLFNTIFMCEHVRKKSERKIKLSGSCLCLIIIISFYFVFVIPRIHSIKHL